MSHAASQFSELQSGFRSFIKLMLVNMMIRNISIWQMDSRLFVILRSALSANLQNHSSKPQDCTHIIKTRVLGRNKAKFKKRHKKGLLRLCL